MKDTKEKQIDIVSNTYRDDIYTLHTPDDRFYLWIVASRCHKYDEEFMFAKDLGVDVLNYTFLVENTHNSIHAGITMEILKNWGWDVTKIRDNYISVNLDSSTPKKSAMRYKKSV